MTLSQLHTLLPALEPIVPTFSPREGRSLLRDATKLFQMSQSMSELMREVYGFTLALRDSSLQGGGRGVFVSSGRVPEKHIVGLYPGEARCGVVTHMFPFQAFAIRIKNLVGKNCAYLLYRFLLKLSIKCMQMFLFGCGAGNKTACLAPVTRMLPVSLEPPGRFFKVIKGVQAFL